MISNPKQNKLVRYKALNEVSAMSKKPEVVSHIVENAQFLEGVCDLANSSIEDRNVDVTLNSLQLYLNMIKIKPLNVLYEGNPSSYDDVLRFFTAVSSNKGSVSTDDEKWKNCESMATSLTKSLIGLHRPT